MRALLVLVLFSCASPPEKPLRPSTSPLASATMSTPSAPLSAPDSITSTLGLPTSAPDLVSPRTIIATFIEGKDPHIACGYLAIIGSFVYEVESVEKGPPLSGKITVEVPCPNDRRSVTFSPGERHRLNLEVAKKTYAQASPPKSLQPGLPRFEGVSVAPVIP
jgi:hypothetical protein